MTGPGARESRDAVTAAAAELFAERGYASVTIRDIAEAAGVSPALVMKCGGSKKELFLRVATVTAPPLPDVPAHRLGETLVAALVERYTVDAVEPLTRAVLLRLSAPEPDAVRERFVAEYLVPLTARLDGPDAAVRAELALAALAGLATTQRILQLPRSREALDSVVARYAPVVQALLDG
ncbi:AcrR family transcriptional regulator [Mumia flava]|uniref:AcrR family transcriptional regulator n=1 Tax=Mumia flava TaxID=1348852 RepID=A0A0B2BPS6_9ACTN|nr:TetR family transcriptional regulator [Mumia flava]PJJ56536.1 AcrR family transcriptional regulator [Mumia flava]